MRKAVVLQIDSDKAMFFDKYLPVLASVLVEQFLNRLSEEDRDRMLKELSGAKRKELKSVVRKMVSHYNQNIEQVNHQKKKEEVSHKTDFDKVFGGILKDL